MFKTYHYIYQNQEFTSKYHLANAYDITVQQAMYWINQKLVTKKEVENLGISKHPLYEVYRNMLRRCYDSTFNNYHRYGERGIRVHTLWLKDFQTFVNDVGPRPLNYTLDRIDNNKNYTPKNCRWIIHRKNCQNTSVAKRWYIQGKKFNSVTEAAAFFKVAKGTIQSWVYGKKQRNGAITGLRKNCYAIKVY